MAAGKTSNLSDLGRLILRLAVGLGIMTHGYSKIFGFNDSGVRNLVGFTEGVARLGFPHPAYFAWAAALSEFAGGILVALGLMTRPAGFFLSCTMIVALYRHRVDLWPRQELAMLYLAPALFCMLSGPGRYSLDAVLFKKK